MRTFAQLSLEVTQDLDQRQELVNQQVTFDDTNALTSSTFSGQVITLLPSAVDVPVAFGGVTNASTMLIIAKAKIAARLNGIGNSAIDIDPVPAVIPGSIVSEFQKYDQPGVVFWHGKVTSIHLSNPSTTDPAQVYVGLVGEAI